MQNLRESEVNIISQGTRLEGHFTFDQICRVHGTLIGDVRALPGSTLILAETSVVEGQIEGDTVMINGFVKGDVRAKTRVVISESGRVIGNIATGSLTIAFGAYFEGRCAMNQPTRVPPPPPTSATSPKPA